MCRCRGVLEEASDWRGRAQHITLLQERLLSLQESQACPLLLSTPTTQVQSDPCARP